MPTTTTRADMIALLNDRCRLGQDPTARLLVTRACLTTFASGSTEDGLGAQAALVSAVRAHQFTGAGAAEKNRGRFSYRGIEVFFSIDYYDLNLNYGSEDPADPGATTRVLTIMVREDL